MSIKIPFRKSVEAASKKTLPPAAPIVPSLPEVALCAIIPCKKQKEVSEYVKFILESLEKNSRWLNDVVSSQQDFKCALLVGAGPNRFQLHQTIFPAEAEDINLDVELRGSDDHDKIAFAAIFKLANGDMNTLLRYTRGKMFQNHLLKEDLVKGENLGINFAILRPISEKQFRIMERIQIGSSLRAFSPRKRREEKSFVRPTLNKMRRVA